MAPPLGDEMPPARHTMAEIARALADAGHPVLRFDYSGCGDSHGRFESLSLARMADDLSTMADFLRQQYDNVPLALIGVRLGAGVALLQAQELAAARMAALAPIVLGRPELRAMGLRTRIRSAVTSSEGGRTASGAEDGSAANEGDIVDWDGLAFSRRMLDDIESLDLRELQPPEIPALLLQIGPRRTPAPELAQLAEQWPQATAQAIYHPPFWNRIEHHDPSPVLQPVVRFLTGDAADDGGSEG
jgi:pimeloyl-ACP methyl ester carboxylesterase